ncbi:polyhydroxyalkanoate synthesis repressor PhaR [Lichenicola sp.]|uniref:polyhydroxyalkanoate synthesis repressor PhaR n=1 Tax=Lichenicola sp. TaxID=2804529 RepID=UPI003B00016A
MTGMEDHLPETDRPVAPVVIKKYANRRLYDTESSIYITLDSLAEMVRRSRDFVVFDAKTGDDITRSVLTQIIVEEETKGRNMLPTLFLRQLIGFYGDSKQGLVPGFLEHVMDQFAAHQSGVVRPAAPVAAVPPPAQRASKAASHQAAAEPAARPILDRAKTLLNPFYKPDPGSAEPAPSSADEAHRAEIERLQAEIDRLSKALAAQQARSST